MQFTLYDAIGVFGTSLIIVTYVLLQIERIKSGTLLYSLLNAAGSLLIIVSLAFSFNFSAFVVEFFWFVISVFGITRYFLRKSDF